jgi:hypothetical protein
MFPTQCISCRHYKGKCACLAFPGGIPVAFLTNKQMHNKKHKGQIGNYVWSKRRSA